MMNQLSCNLALAVVPEAGSRHVIVGDTVLVLSPCSVITNCGSNGDAAGIAGALRHGPERSAHTSGANSNHGPNELSQLSSIGAGSVAATNIANKLVTPSDVSVNSLTSGGLVRASTIS